MMFILNSIISVLSYLLGSVFYPLFVGIPLAILDFLWDLLLNFMSYFTFTNIVFNNGTNKNPVTNGSNFLNSIGISSIGDWQSQPIVVIWFSMIVTALIIGIIFSLVVIIKRATLNSGDEYKSFGGDLTLATKRLFIGAFLIIVFPFGIQFILGLINWIFFQMTSAANGVSSDQLQKAALAHQLVQRLSLIKQADLKEDLQALMETIPTQTVSNAEATNTLAGDFSNLKSYFDNDGILDYVNSWDYNMSALTSKLSRLASSNNGDININLSSEIKNLLLSLDSFLVKLQQLTQGVSNLDKYNVLNEVVQKPELIENLTKILKNLNGQGATVTNSTLFSLFRDYKNLILDNENLKNTLGQSDKLVYPTFEIRDVKSLLAGTSNKPIQEHFFKKDGGALTLVEILNLLNTNAFKANVAGLTNSQVSLIEQMVNYGTLNPTSDIISFKSLVSTANEMTDSNLKDPTLVFRLGQFRKLWATTFFSNNNNAVFANLNSFTNPATGTSRKVDVGSAGQITLGLSELLKGSAGQFSKQVLSDTTLSNLKFTDGYLTERVLDRADADIINTVRSLGSKHPVSLADIGLKIALEDADARYLGFSLFQWVRIENAVFSFMITGALLHTVIVFFMYLIKRMVTLILLFLFSPFAIFTNLHEPAVSNSGSGSQFRTNWRGYVWATTYLSESTSILMAALSLMLFTALIEPILNISGSIVNRVSPVDRTSEYYGTVLDSGVAEDLSLSAENPSSISLFKTMFSGVITIGVLKSISKVQEFASKFISGWIFSKSNWYEEGKTLTDEVSKQFVKGGKSTWGAGKLAKQGIAMGLQFAGGAVAAGAASRTARVANINNRLKPLDKKRKVGWLTKKINKSHSGMRFMERQELQNKFNNAENLKEKRKFKEMAKERGFNIGDRKTPNSLKNIYAYGNTTGKEKDRAKKAAKGVDLYTGNAFEKLGLGNVSDKVDMFQNWRKDVNEAKNKRGELRDEFEDIKKKSGDDGKDDASLRGYLVSENKKHKVYESEGGKPLKGKRRAKRKAEGIELLSSINEAAPNLAAGGDNSRIYAKRHADQIVKVGSKINDSDIKRTVINQVSSLSSNQIESIKNEGERKAIVAIKEGNSKNKHIELIASNMKKSYGDVGFETKVVANKIIDASSNLESKEQETILKNAYKTSLLSAKELYQKRNEFVETNPNWEKTDNEKVTKWDNQIIREANIAQHLSTGLSMGSSNVKHMVKNFEEFEKKLRNPKDINTIYQNLNKHNLDNKISNENIVIHSDNAIERHRKLFLNKGVPQESWIETSFALASQKNSAALSEGKLNEKESFRPDKFIANKKDKRQTQNAILGKNNVFEESRKNNGDNKKGGKKDGSYQSSNNKDDGIT